MIAIINAAADPQDLILDVVLKKPMFDILSTGMRRVLDEVGSIDCLRADR